MWGPSFWLHRLHVQCFCHAVWKELIKVKFSPICPTISGQPKFSLGLNPETGWSPLALRSNWWTQGSKIGKTAKINWLPFVFHYSLEKTPVQKNNSENRWMKECHDKKFISKWYKWKRDQYVSNMKSTHSWQHASHLNCEHRTFHINQEIVRFSAQNFFLICI